MQTQFSIIGHRGWPSDHVENTLSGLLAAARIVDAIEVDVRRCGDGRLVLAHDPQLGGVPVADTPWSKLSKLDLGGGHHPVLLDEALAALPSTRVQLEVKNTPGEPGYEPDHRLALEAASRARPGDVVTSFNWESLSAVRRVFPDVATGLVFGTAVSLDEAVKEGETRGHRALIPHHSLIVEPLNLEFEVDVWTVNDVGVASKLVELGVNGIITDDPGLMTRHFEGTR